IGEPHWRARKNAVLNSLVVGEHLDAAIFHMIVGFHLCRRDRIGLEFPVCCPSRFYHRKRQTARPTPEASPLPPAPNCVSELAGTGEQGFAFPERKSIDPICRDKVSGIEVRNAPTLARIPDILDSAIGSDRAFSIGSHVNGF